MNIDGGDVRQLTDHKVGAWQPIVGPQGQFAYLARYDIRTKLRPVDLCIVREGKHQTLAEGIYITDHCWSPDGERIAYGTVGKLVFQNLKTSKKTEVLFDTIDERLHSFGSHFLNWRPDGLAVACRITFLGGRAVGTKMFGDNELFVIPVEGKPNWFRPTLPIQRAEWVR